MKLIVVLMLFISLMGCSLDAFRPEPPPDKEAAAVRQQLLKELTRWGLHGRIIIKTKAESLSATLIWKQDKLNWTANLFGTLGVGSVRLQQTPERASLQRSGSKPVYALTAEKLVLWELGLRIPLRGMSDWLKGMPGSASEVRYDQYGRLKSLQYLDEYGVLWRAEFQSFRQVAGRQLPVLISVEGGGFTIDLATRQWDAELPELNKPKPTRLSIPGVNQ